MNSPNFVCVICNQPVSLETANTDEDGRPVHGECYTLAAKLKLATTLPERAPPTSEIIRCPYCVEDNNFKIMKGRAEVRWFLCPGCCHAAMPESSSYQCTCPKCVKPDPLKA